MSKLKTIALIVIGGPLAFALMKGVTTDQDNTAPVQDSAQTAQSIAAPATPVAANNWEYYEAKDEMRGETNTAIVNTSINQAQFEFPYNGGSNLQIMIRNNEEIMLVVTSGQFDCGYRGCDITAKFDDGPLETYKAARADGGISSTIFLDGKEAAFIDKLKNSQQVIIETKFFSHGTEQFTFKTPGIK